MQTSEDTISWKSWLGLLILAMVIAGLVALSKWLARRDPTLGGHGAQHLLSELATAHDLSWRERWLLKRTARAARLDHPVHVFMDRSVYENAETARRMAHVWPRILQIRDRLFAQDTTP